MAHSTSRTTYSCTDHPHPQVHPTSYSPTPPALDPSARPARAKKHDSQQTPTTQRQSRCTRTCIADEATDMTGGQADRQTALTPIRYPQPRSPERGSATHPPRST
ncbi:hypothetical protein BDV59DRAFT_92798 [Aspergillus ambiguus]|uniref:uncharacterized protein n=1 Tax=Aspergillus ambiguus TaxID=176160 RepID=UPI003CCCAC92